MSTGSNPRSQINIKQVPYVPEGRKDNFTWTREPMPYPRLGVLLVEARKAAAVGDKEKCNQLWQQINEIRASKRTNNDTPKSNPL